LDPPQDVRRLAEALSAVPQVSRYSTAEEPQGWILAQSFDELAQSFRILLGAVPPGIGRGPVSRTNLRRPDVHYDFRRV